MVAVLVTDGEQRAALAIARSLGVTRYDVYVCSERARPLAGASRYVRGHAQVPSVLSKPAEFFVAVEHLIERWKIDVLLPVTDASLLTVLQNRDNLRKVSVPFPDAEQFRMVADKANVLEAATRIGIATPRQLTIRNPECISGLQLTDHLAYPVIVKTSRSVAEVNGMFRQFGIRRARDGDSLMHALGQIPDSAYPVLLQETIRGPGVGIFLLIWNGQLLAHFAHRRLREKPPSGGVSVYRESIACDESLLHMSLELLRGFGWQGVAMVEYKISEQTGVPYLMEINGRFWGSLQLAIDSGVDFPKLLVAACTGQSPVPVTKYDVGVRSRWFWGDVDQLLLRLIKPHRYQLPGGRIRSFWEFLATSISRYRLEVLRPNDPMPFVRETMNWLLRR